MSEHNQSVSLDDKYLSTEGSVYITGIQALVRVALERARLDRLYNLKTGGFISGYRGSPLGGFDTELVRSHDLISQQNIHFQPGVNEELGATAVMGSQKIDISGKGSDFDGIFGIWYGKAPGVDRAGDALRQSNYSGTHRKGGVLALAGDDHLAKSSVVTQQSETFFVHAEIPVFNPSDIQDVLDFGLHALELSRFSSLWVAMICVSDTMDASATIDVDLNRYKFLKPADHNPRQIVDLNRGLYLQGRLEHEQLLRELRLPSVAAYVQANKLDGIRFGSATPRFGIVTTGKAYRDLRQAFAMLGMTEQWAKEAGIAIYKVALSWPVEPVGIKNFSKSLDKLLVVEHKRAFLEKQIKDLLYNSSLENRVPIWGKTNTEGEKFLPDIGELSAEILIPAIISFLPSDLITDEMRQIVEAVQSQQKWAKENFEHAQRIPYFCSGCPHSRSIKVPDGARAMPGIGCHAMSETAGFTTDGQIAMGNEGALWVGQSPFSRDKHVFVNLGDGTYFHSGILAIRQAVAAKVPVTYKVLVNDAVAMTGGQPIDGPLSIPQLSRQLEAEGVEKIVVLSEKPELYKKSHRIAPNTPVKHRDELMGIQQEFAEYNGVSVIIYDQTCATEKRRRRKRGTYEIPNKRLFINQRVCEDCGDCSVQSNCLSVEPIYTDFGRKRKINQSSCNMDFSCVNGFCPSFAWIEGAELQKIDTDSRELDSLLKNLPEIKRDELDKTVNVLIAGIGGMGVTTSGAVLAMAAHIDEKKSSTLDMTGIAQKGGPVTSHVRISTKEIEIEGPRIPTASLDVLIASDMLLASSEDILSHVNRERTHIFANSRIAPTAEFVINQELTYDNEKIRQTLMRAGQTIRFENIASLSEKLLGDAIYTNMILVGMSLQSGVLPLSSKSVEDAIKLNGVAIESNLNAFRIGRQLIIDADSILKYMPDEVDTDEISPQERINFLYNDLTEYQDNKYSSQFLSLVKKIQTVDYSNPKNEGKLTLAVAENLYKVMAYKDEYEVARLYSDPAFLTELTEQFGNYNKIKLSLSPPLFSRIDKNFGRPRKITFGPWIFKIFRVLQRLKKVRGTWLDLFGYNKERKMERALINQYKQDIQTILEYYKVTPYDLLVEFAQLPKNVRGFGPIKIASIHRMNVKREELLTQLNNDDNQTQSQILEAAE